VIITTGRIRRTFIIKINLLNDADSHMDNYSTTSNSPTLESNIKSEANYRLLCCWTVCGEEIRFCFEVKAPWCCRSKIKYSISRSSSSLKRRHLRDLTEYNILSSSVRMRLQKLLHHPSLGISSTCIEMEQTRCPCSCEKK
jgi:hypothetical protein